MDRRWSPRPTPAIREPVAEVRLGHVIADRTPVGLRAWAEAVVADMCRAGVPALRGGD